MRRIVRVLAGQIANIWAEQRAWAGLASIAGLQVLKQTTNYWVWTENRGVDSEGSAERIDGGLSFFGLRYLKKYLLGEGL